MPFTQAGQLARETPVARPDDTLGLVAENLRESHYGTLPVVEGDFADASSPGGKSSLRLLGLIDERDLSRAVLPLLQRAEAQRIEAQNAPPSNNGEAVLQPAFVGAPAENANAEASRAQSQLSSTQSPFVMQPHEAIEAANNGFYGTNGSALATEPDSNITDLTARDVMRLNTTFVPAAFSLHNALLTLERYDCNALPVLDATGNYRGMISRADVIAALGQQVRPPAVGGMATPLGVWLTTGHVSGGAKPLGLFLSGATLGLYFFVAHYGLLIALQYLNPEWAMMFLSGRLGALSSFGGLLNIFFAGLEILLFLLIIRATPMSGIHAAEHQTVWAIERGLPLRAEFVSQMPRAHPRCGTNLVALAGLIQITLGHLPTFDPMYVLLSLLFIYFAWRSFGTLLQEWFMTRPASPKQIESGIRAGIEVMEKYQAQPHVMGSFGQRLFNSGILLSGLGIILTMTLMQYAAEWLMRTIGF